ncbi:MAG TPA: hypothetical protein VLG38_01330 [Gammaproteobacteria bacterium]|nr:hypothetical protein [Gammaproteobacteria bacterium]
MQAVRQHLGVNYLNKFLFFISFLIFQLQSHGLPLLNRINNILIDDRMPNENKMHRIVALREMAVHNFAIFKRSIIFSGRNIVYALMRMLQKNTNNDNSAANTELTCDESQQIELMQRYGSILAMAAVINLHAIKKSYDSLHPRDRIDSLQLRDRVLIPNAEGVIQFQAAPQSLRQRQFHIQEIQDRVGETLGLLAAIAYLYNQVVTFEELESWQTTYTMATGYTLGNIASRAITHGYKMYRGDDLGLMQEPPPSKLTDELKSALVRTFFFEMRP